MSRMFRRRARRLNLFKPLVTASMAVLLSFVGNRLFFSDWGFTIPNTAYIAYFFIVLVGSMIFFMKGVMYSPIVGSFTALLLLLFVGGYSVPTMVLIWFVHAAIGTISSFIANTFVR